MSKGYVYILTNPCIQYTFKEGGKDVTISPVSKKDAYESLVR